MAAVTHQLAGRGFGVGGNFMNRFVDGLGSTAGPGFTAMSSRRLTDIEYAGLKDLL